MYVLVLLDVSSPLRDVKLCVFFFQAEDGIRDLVRSRGLGDVYKRQDQDPGDGARSECHGVALISWINLSPHLMGGRGSTCLLYTSDAADERSSVDLGGRRIIKKKKNLRSRENRQDTNKNK